MAGVRFTLKDEDANKLIESIKEFAGNAEDVIAQTLENKVADILKTSIEGLIPISNRNKTHAKYSAPFTDDMQGKLSVYIHTKKSYHYLYFPDEGEGTSKGQMAHDFTGEGVENEYDNTVNLLLDALIKEWNN